MRSNRLAGRRAQSGQSLVEALVASMVLGVGIVTALTGLDTMLTGANVATRQAWASCAVRAEAGILEATPWRGQGDYVSAIGNVSVSASDAGAGLQMIVITARDSSNRVLARSTMLKAEVLSGSAPPSGSPPVGAWCSYVTRAAP